MMNGNMLCVTLKLMTFIKCLFSILESDDVYQECGPQHNSDTVQRYATLIQMTLNIYCALSGLVWLMEPMQQPLDLSHEQGMERNRFFCSGKMIFYLLFFLYRKGVKENALSVSAPQIER